MIITSLRQMTPHFSGCILREASNVLKGCEEVHLNSLANFNVEHVIKSEPQYLIMDDDVLQIQENLVDFVR